MSKFKVGDKVRVLPRLEGQHNQSPYYVGDMTEYEGEEFVIKKICTTTGFIELDNLSFDWHEDWLELVDKPFTQEDFEIGMLVEFESGKVYKPTHDLAIVIGKNSRDVVAIYKPTETGFEKVWTKPEPKLYTLELPNNTKKQRYYGVHTELDEHYQFGKMVTNGTFKTQFTLEEIENLPNQDLIEVLVKKEIV